MNALLAALCPPLSASLLAAMSLLAQPANPAASKPQKPAGHPGAAQADATLNWPKARPEDVNSVDAIIKAFYAVPAGEKGESRDWDRYASLFTPDARMIPARADDKGNAIAMYVTIGEYVGLNKTYFEKGGFRDTEINRKVEEFGHIAHVWSTFESRHSAADAEPYVRGINSIQLLKDGDRWWIVNVFWDFEGPNATLPAAGTPGSEMHAVPAAPGNGAAPASDAAAPVPTPVAPTKTDH